MSRCCRPFHPVTHRLFRRMPFVFLFSSNLCANSAHIRQLVSVIIMEEVVCIYANTDHCTEFQISNRIDTKMYGNEFKVDVIQFIFSYPHTRSFFFSPSPSLFLYFAHTRSRFLNVSPWHRTNNSGRSEEGTVWMQNVVVEPFRRHPLNEFSSVQTMRNRISVECANFNPFFIFCQPKFHK